MLEDVIKTAEFGGKAVVSVNKNAIRLRADNCVGLCGMFNHGKMTSCVGNEVVLWDGGRQAVKHA